MYSTRVGIHFIDINAHNGKEKGFFAFLSSVAGNLYTNVHFIYAVEFKMISLLYIALYVYYNQDTFGYVTVR